MMIYIIFYFSSFIAVAATVMAITGRNAVHSLMYFILSLLAAAVVIYILGAPFIAALEVIIYAGAIMVMFVFVVMMLKVTNQDAAEKQIFTGGMWIGPSILSIILLVLIIYVFFSADQTASEVETISPKKVGLSLFSTYLLCVELAGMILMSGIIGAYHLGRERRKTYHRFLKGDSE